MNSFMTQTRARVTASVAGLAIAGVTVVAGATGAVAGAPTNQECAGYTSTPISSLGAFNWADTKSGGHAALVEDGLHIWTTEPQGSLSKVAGYIPVDFPLAATGDASMAYAPTSGEAPGMNLTLSIDGAAWSGNLVYEPLFDKWWSTRPIPGVDTHGPNWSATNPNYQASYGTLDEILQGSAGHDIRVIAVGFSLGGNAIGDGVINSITANCVTYSFDGLSNEVGGETSDITVTNIEKQGFNLDWDTRATGHYEFQVEGGLKTWTEAATSSDKVAGLVATDFPLSGLGEVGLDYTAEFGGTPGVQVVVDVDHDGTDDGILVGESIYGGNWWANRTLSAFLRTSTLANVAPTEPAPGGTDPYNGTIDQWLALFGDATVTGVGYSLGSGVYASGVLNSVTANNTRYVFGAWETGFADVTLDNNTFARDIAWLREQRITNGYVDGGVRNFHPLENVSREAMAAFLYRAAGSPEFDVPEVSPFLDVPTTHTFYKEIAWLADQGIARGYQVDGGWEFHPLEDVSRQAMAAFLYRAAGSPEYTVAEDPFLDVTSANSFSKEIAWLADQEIAQGYEADGGWDFHPLESVTRQAMAAFLHRDAINVG